MLKYLIVLPLISFFFYAHSTTFVPVSIKKQIKSSDGILEGEVISLLSEEKDGFIYSKVTILANRWMGLEPENDFVDIYFPGGEIAGKTSRVQGSPRFDIGEDVVLLTKIQQDKHWINNLGMGKFSMKKIGDRALMINQIFPAHPEIGQISLDKFIALAEWVKKEEFQERLKDKYELNYETELKSYKKKSQRSIASIENSKLPGSDEAQSSSIMWLLLIFAGLGTIFGIVKNRA